MTIQESNNRLVGDLNAVMQDTRELLKVTAGRAGEQVGKVRTRLASALESAKNTYHELPEKSVKVAKATDRVIRANPYESLGVAFGIGVVIGVLVSRR